MYFACDFILSVHWAGSYTATSWCDSLAGAAQAGQRAATEVVAALK